MDIVISATPNEITVAEISGAVDLSAAGRLHDALAECVDDVPANVGPIACLSTWLKALPTRLIASLAHASESWKFAKAIRQLSQFDDHQLKDIGLGRSDLTPRGLAAAAARRRRQHAVFSDGNREAPIVASAALEGPSAQIIIPTRFAGTGRAIGIGQDTQRSAIGSQDTDRRSLRRNWS